MSSQELEMEDSSRTALGLAKIRAWESERDNRLFYDPYSKLFFGDQFENIKQTSSNDAGTSFEKDADLVKLLFSHIILRTKLFDDHLLSYANKCGNNQIVILASGLDTRAFRLDWPDDINIIEIDIDSIVDFKENFVKKFEMIPKCSRIALKGDLRMDLRSQLEGLSLDLDRPIFWLAEGIFPYLNSEEVMTLLHAIDDMSVTGSNIGFDDGSHMLTSMGEKNHLSKYSSIFLSHEEDILCNWLSSRAWQVNKHSGSDIVEIYNRSELDCSGKFVLAVKQ